MKPQLDISIHVYKKTRKGFFHSRDPAMSSRGGLTRGLSQRGGHRASRAVGWDRGADPHTWISALQ